MERSLLTANQQDTARDHTCFYLSTNAPKTSRNNTRSSDRDSR